MEAGRADGKAVLWQTLKAHEGPVWRLEFDQLGTTLGSSGDDGAICLYRSGWTGCGRLPHRL